MGFFDRIFGRSRAEPKQVARIEGDGRFGLDIVGESHYQDALEEICGGRCVDGHRKEVEALLIHEDSNPHDNKAIAVTIQGEVVGYLDRKTARSFRKRMAEAGVAGITAVCNAKIVGGWDRGGGDAGHFGVKLDIPTQ